MDYGGITTQNGPKSSCQHQSSELSLNREVSGCAKIVLTSDRQTKLVASFGDSHSSQVFNVSVWERTNPRLIYFSTRFYVFYAASSLELKLTQSSNPAIFLGIRKCVSFLELSREASHGRCVNPC